LFGDPVQIEPVVTLPGTLTQNICRRFGVDPDLYNAPEASAQTLAIRRLAYFAEFETSLVVVLWGFRYWFIGGAKSQCLAFLMPLPIRDDGKMLSKLEIHQYKPVWVLRLG